MGMNNINKRRLGIEEIYKIAIDMGIKKDFRHKKEIERILKREKERYGEMKNEEKEYFDKDQLFNPFSDTRILNVTKKKIVKKILAGIDIGSGEILFADKHRDIDLIISHHPLGKALSNLSDVMHLQADVLNYYGIPINIAESLVNERISEVSRGVNPINHNQLIDLARLFDVNLMCVHTPADNLAAKYLEERLNKSHIYFVGDIIKMLKKIPEYREAIKIGAGPKIFVGSENNRVGKVVLTEITGGTSMSPKIYEKMSLVGIGTIVSMHMSEEHKKNAEKAHINVVVAGHMSSDSLGMNLFLDKLEDEGMDIVSCAGLTRVARIQK